MSDYTSILFARPSAIEGAGRLMDFGNTMSEYNTSPSGEEADALAFWADWSAIGSDIMQVFRGASVQAIAKK